MVTPVTEDTKLVTITIDGKEYQVPKGGNLVDLAKWYAGNDIPVFCYHPKMDPVGMCRMCVVELGRPRVDRQTREPVLNDDGTPVIDYHPKLQTACTQTVYEGMHVRTNTEKVSEGRESVLEFLLTSHPLDCPICDKGGECPLQNLTMAHGPGVSRMYYEDKMHLDKHYPLGDLIFLDRERCIQCARCVRFQEEIVGDDVLAFHERGRRLQIITNSDPGFDTYFSGNTTDICPVGALTTADFRFGARPWELNEVPSVSPWDAAGENISLSTRLDRDFGGRAMIKRVMPRQNELVNEIWISDKTRFGHHYTRSENRLLQPMIRQGDSLRETNWEGALKNIASALVEAEGDIAALAGGLATNEDLWELRELMTGLGSERLGAWTTHGGAAAVARAGLADGANLGKLGKGDAVLIIASDLEEEVPNWRLRLKQAQDRGAYLVVANARHTRMEDFALDTWEESNRVVEGAAIRYEAGQAVQAMLNLKSDHPEIAERLTSAENLVIVAGTEGLTPEGSAALSQAAANFLSENGFVGKANSGLLATLPGPNGMGLHYMGFTPEAAADMIANPPQVLILLHANVLDDDPSAKAWLDQVNMVIDLTLFPDETVYASDYALPVQSFAERDGTYTNGERRVQRFYTAQGPMGDALPAWKALTNLREKLGQGRGKLSAAAVMLDITKNHPAFEGMRYKDLARTQRQFPDVGGDDKYYGGTAYQNKGGLGKQIALEAGDAVTVEAPAALAVGDDQLLIVPSSQLYDRSTLFKPSTMMHPRVPLPYALLNTDDANRLGILHGDTVEVDFGEDRVRVRAVVSQEVSAGAIVLPRYLTTTPTPMTPTAGSVRKVTEPIGVEA